MRQKREGQEREEVLGGGTEVWGMKEGSRLDRGRWDTVEGSASTSSMSRNTPNACMDDDLRAIFKDFDGDKVAIRELAWLFSEKELKKTGGDSVDVKGAKFQGFRKHFKKQFTNEAEYASEIRKLQGKPSMIGPFL